MQNTGAHVTRDDTVLSSMTWAERADIPVDRTTLIREGWWWELVTEVRFNKLMKEKGVIK